jgi:hypothetical protein
MSDLGLLKERAKYKKLCIEFEALQVVVQVATIESNRAAKEAMAELEMLKKAEVRKRNHILEAKISEIRKVFGAQVPNSVFVQLSERARAVPGKDFLVPKFLVRNYFLSYGKVFPNFDLLPEHASIGFHDGTERESVGEIEVYLLEAKLYEDMCGLFNLAKEIAGRVSVHTQGKSKTDSKKLEACCRATTTSAFYFVESYLNGLAYDHYVTHMKTLDEKNKQILTEWDIQKDCPRYLSLREKILQYPRIILGSIHPPFQENNCVEVKFLLERVKVLRDAIAHPSPGPNLIKMEPGKERELFNAEFNEVEPIVDNSIALVRKIERLIRGDELRLDWLHERGGDGFFPDTVFR